MLRWMVCHRWKYIIAHNECNLDRILYSVEFLSVIKIKVHTSLTSVHSNLEH